MTTVLQGDSKTPRVGKHSWMFYGVGIAGVYVAYRWYKSRQAAAAAAASPAATGMYATDMSGYGLSTSGGTSNIAGNTGATVTDATGGAITTNAAWTQQAVTLLTQTGGYDAATVYTALGDFLARVHLTPSEATIARSALAAAGNPPVGGPYTVIEGATASDTGTLAAPANLRAWNAPTPSTIGMQWDAVTGAAHYQIFRGGLSETVGDAAGTSFTAQGLTANTSYSFTVKAVGTTGKAGSASNTLTVKTPGIHLVPPSGLRASNITQSSFRVTCNTVPGATLYHWRIDGMRVGATEYPYIDITHQRANSTYHVTVASDTTSQNASQQSAPLTVKTKR